MAVRPSPSAGAYSRMSQEERLAQINNEVLQSADIAPPAYEEVAVHRTEIPESQARATPRSLAPASSSSAPAPAYAPDSKLAQDLAYYSQNRGAGASARSPPPRQAQTNSAYSEKFGDNHVAQQFADESFSDDSYDSDEWEKETLADAQHTPGSSVFGDDHRPELAQSRSAPLQQHPQRPPALDRSLSALDRLRERHGLPQSRLSGGCCGSGSRDAYRAAKEAYRAEKRATRDAYRQERDERRAAYRQERDELREEKRGLRDQRRALRRDR